ncbi:MAG: tetratricopeptide repeat protein, partial [Myxococcota bacterium]
MNLDKECAKEIFQRVLKERQAEASRAPAQESDLPSQPPVYESIEDYASKTGKRFRMTKDQKSRELSREEAFNETFGGADDEADEVKEEPGQPGEGTTPPTGEEFLAVIRNLEKLLPSGKKARPPSTDTSEPVAIKANKLQEEGKLPEALKLREEALEIARGLVGEEHRLFATRLNQLGWTQEASGKLEDALDNRKRALEIERVIFDDTHPEVGLSFFLLGQVHEKLATRKDGIRIEFENAFSQQSFFAERRAHLESALDCWERSLSIDRKVHGNDHMEVAVDLVRIAGVQKHLGMESAAWRCSLESLAIRDRRKDESSLNVRGWIDAKLGSHVVFSHGSLAQVKEATRELPKDTGLQTQGRSGTRDAGWTPLGCAARWNPDPAVISYLISR